MSLLEQLEQEKITALSELESARTEADLEAWRLAHLGKSAPVMQAFSALGSASKEERPLIGKTANAVKVALESAFASKNEAIRQLALATAVEKERLDVTDRIHHRHRTGHFAPVEALQVVVLDQVDQLVRVLRVGGITGRVDRAGEALRTGGVERGGVTAVVAQEVTMVEDRGGQ